MGSFRDRAASQPDQPWLLRKEWASNRIRSHKRWEVVILWAFAVAWSLISIPLAHVQIPKALARGETLVAWIIGGMLLAAAGLIAAAVRATWDVHRHGDVRLVMDPFPGSIGGHVGASIDLPAVAYRPDLRFDVTLRCAYHDQTRSGGSNSTRSREHMVWQTAGVAQVQPHGAGTCVSFRFNVPHGLPSSAAPVGDSEHHWTVLLKCTDPALKFSRQFDVPVYATRTESAWLGQDAATHPLLQAQHEAELNAIRSVKLVDGGVHLYQPYGRLWRHNLLWLVMGGAFFGFGLAAKAMAAPWVFVVLFGGVGGAMLLWGFFALCNSLRVQLDAEGLRTERRLLGLMFAWHQVPRNGLRGLQRVLSYTSQSGAEHTEWYRIRVVLQDGKTITVADSLEGKEVADQMLHMLTKASGLPVQPG